MNSSEIQLIEYFIGGDSVMMGRALTKMFFAPEGQMMGRYQKAAFDAIRRKFNGDRYKPISVKETYDTAMGVVYPKLIDILRKEKESFNKENKATLDSISPATHWTSKYGNFCSFLSTVIEREANRSRREIDAILSLDPKDFGLESFDESRMIHSREVEIRDHGTSETEETVQDTTLDTYEMLMIGNQPDSEDLGFEQDELEEIEEQEGGQVLDGSEEVPNSAENGDAAERMRLISILHESISNLKEKDRDIINTILLGGMSEEEYAVSHNVDIEGLYRDKARARGRLIVEMIPYIQQYSKSLVRKYIYLLDDFAAELISDIVIREISFKDVAISRDCRVSDIQTKFSSAYAKIMKEYNSCLAEEAEIMAQKDKKLDKAYARYIGSLMKSMALPE